MIFIKACPIFTKLYEVACKITQLSLISVLSGQGQVRMPGDPGYRAFHCIINCHNTIDILKKSEDYGKLKSLCLYKKSFIVVMNL